MHDLLPDLAAHAATHPEASGWCIGVPSHQGLQVDRGLPLAEPAIRCDRKPFSTSWRTVSITFGHSPIRDRKNVGAAASIQYREQPETVCAGGCCSTLTQKGAHMAAKKKRPARFDIHGSFAAHLRANQRAHEWAAKSIAYREAGKRAQAKTAEGKARTWLRKAMALEAHAVAGMPSGGRRAAYPGEG